MNKQEAAKLLSLIKLSYPTAYRDIDKETANATVNMWQMSFPDVPYGVMEQAFNHYRMTSKFPPTVAEMVEELKGVYYQALELANIQKNLGNEDMVQQFMAIMACTSRYKNDDNLGGLTVGCLNRMLGGDYNGQKIQAGPSAGRPYAGLDSGYECRNELRPLEGTASPY